MVLLPRCAPGVSGRWLVHHGHSSNRQGPHQHHKLQLKVQGQTPCHGAGSNSCGDACEQSCETPHFSCLQERSRWYTHQGLDFRGVQCSPSRSEAKQPREDGPSLLLPRQPAHDSSLAQHTHFKPCAPVLRYKIHIHAITVASPHHAVKGWERQCGAHVTDQHGGKSQPCH